MATVRLYATGELVTVPIYRSSQASTDSTAIGAAKHFSVPLLQQQLHSCDLCMPSRSMHASMWSFVLTRFAVSAIRAVVTPSAHPTCSTRVEPQQIHVSVAALTGRT
jgi:hypothetical protein